MNVFFLFTMMSTSGNPLLVDPARGYLLDADIMPMRVHLSHSGKTLVVGGLTDPPKADWKVFDLITGNIALHSTERCWGTWAVCLSPDDALVAAGGNRNLLYVMDRKTGKLYWDLTNEGHLGVIKELYFSSDSKHLISIAQDMMIRVWDIPNKKPLAVFRFTSTNPNFNDWQLPNYVEKAKRVYDVKGKYNTIGPCAFAPDGKSIAIADLEGKVRFIDFASGNVVKILQAKAFKTTSIRFSSDGKWLLAGCDDKEIIEIWDVEKNQLVKSLGTEEGRVGDIAISPDKSTILISGDGFRVWDVATGKKKYSYFGKNDPKPDPLAPKGEAGRIIPADANTYSAGAAFLPDGKTFLIAPWWEKRDMQMEIYFYETATGRPVDYRQAAKNQPIASK